MIHKNNQYKCAFEFAIDMVSGKWKALVLFYLNDETLRHAEIRKKLAPITQKMLTQTLRDLEQDGLITRKVYPVVPPKVEYTITENGGKLMPIFKMLEIWGEKTRREAGMTKEPPATKSQ